MLQKKIKKTIISILLIIVLLLGEIMCVSANQIETVPFTIGQNLSGTIAKNGVVYYQFSLTGKKTITLDTTVSDTQFEWEILDYNDKSYASQGSGSFDYNSITGTYATTYSVTLNKGTYYLRVKHDPYMLHEGPVAYSINTKMDEVGSVSGIPGTIKIGIRLKKGKSLQLSSILSGMTGKTTWKSSKKSVAKVSSKGKVTAKKKGTATITATCKGKKAKIKVKVY